MDQPYIRTRSNAHTHGCNGAPERRACRPSLLCSLPQLPPSVPQLPEAPPRRHTLTPTGFGVSLEPNQALPSLLTTKHTYSLSSLTQELTLHPHCRFPAETHTAPSAVHGSGCPRGASPPRPVGLQDLGKQTGQSTQAGQDTPTFCSNGVLWKEKQRAFKTPENAVMHAA